MCREKLNKAKILFVGKHKKRLVSMLFGMCGFLIAPKSAFADAGSGVTAGKLAETGDIIATLAIITGVIAVIALVISIISKKSKSKNKSSWKYPF